MKDIFDLVIKGKRVLILGMGLEGRSTYRFLRRLYPEQVFTISDRRSELEMEKEFIHPATIIRQGAGYLDGLASYDLIIKSPGISLSLLPAGISPDKITSQTELFLRFYRDRTIGITGTKGKSTTASLTHHLLKAAGKDVLLVGNIGLPPFDVTDQIKDQTLIVFELSSHQLEGTSVSPHVAVLLNLYQEHLDHYSDFRAYQLAKYNIVRWQQPGDHFIYHKNDSLISGLVDEMKPVSRLSPFSLKEGIDIQTFSSSNAIYSKSSGIVEKICDLDGLDFLAGNHNLLNLLAALAACRSVGIQGSSYCNALKSFRALEHRMEFFGEYGGIRFYNDSIATIPEAVIYAIETIGNVDTLILGGYDRGIDYTLLIDYLGKSDIKNYFFTGNAGKRLINELQSGYPGKHNYQWFEEFDEMVAKAITSTSGGRACLLSPAAASYDKFMNFEHRGNRFKELVRNWFLENKSKDR